MAEPAPADDAWMADVEALVGGWSDPRPAADLSGLLTRWAQAVAPPGAVVAGRSAGPLPDGATVLLPGSLVCVDDPEAVLTRVADDVGPGGRVVVAVPWCRPTEGAVRSLHPASLLGLLAARFAVEEVVALDGLLGARAHVEPDADARRAAAHRALLDVQADVERRLEAGARAELELAALRAADEQSWAAVSAADDAEQRARQERNDARARLREERERVASEQAATARERDVLARRLTDAQRRADRAEQRAARVEGSRLWRVRLLLSGVRRRPVRVLLLPVRLLRVLWSRDE